MGKSIGNSYAFRDYFHGRGYDLVEGEEEDIAPIEDVNLSATYSSSTSGNLKVAFTVPVISGKVAQRQTIGVLGMSVDLGEFGVLETDLHSGQIVVLVDSRMDSVDGEPRRGLVLQHPELNQTNTGQRSTRISETWLQHIDSPDGTFLLRGYDDPFSSGTWIASFERVIVEGRRLPVGDTGWIVLVQERAELR